MSPTAGRRVRVAVIGAGFSGVGMAARLRQRGEDSLVLLERADEFGGTWRENTYPGAACNIRSDLYSFSFAPNLVFLVGPNTVLGPNSVVDIIESQVEYALDGLERAADGLLPGQRAVWETTTPAQRAWSDRIQADLAGSVWSTGGCTSFYLDAHGRNTTLWPHRLGQFHRAVRRFRPEEHHRRVVTDRCGSPVAASGERGGTGN